MDFLVKLSEYKCFETYQGCLMFGALQILGNDEAWLELVLEMSRDEESQLVNMVDFIPFRLVAEKFARPRVSLAWGWPYNISVRHMFGTGWSFNDAVLSLDYSDESIAVRVLDFCPLWKTGQVSGPLLAF